MKRDPLPAKVLATRLIPNVAPDMAKELGLTPATVSHHMGILLSNQLVTVEKREAKLRYRLDREAVGEVVKGLVGVFGLEDMV